MFNQLLGCIALSPNQALSFIYDTGYFYLFISFSFLCFFLFLYKKSKALQIIKYSQLLFIFLWGLAGLTLLLAPLSAVVFCVSAISILAIKVLWVTLKVGNVLAKINISLPTMDATSKSYQYYQELQANKITPENIVVCSQINEFILWSVILYRSLMTLYAAWTLQIG